MLSGTSCGPVSLLLLNSGILTAKDFLIASVVQFCGVGYVSASSGSKKALQEGCQGCAGFLALRPKMTATSPPNRELGRNRVL